MPELSPERQEFRFHYNVFGVVATLDEARLVVQVGMKTIVAPMDRLQHLYVIEGSGGDGLELLLTFTTAAGKLKRTRIFSDRGQPAFEALVQAVLARRPDIDIRGLPLDEVWRRVGTKRLEWVVLPAILAAGWLVVAVVFLPLLRHGFDGGHAELSVAELLAGPDPRTRNLTLRGRLVPEWAVQAQAPDPGQVRMWIPLVDLGAGPEEPVGVVLELRGVSSADLEAVLAADRFEGVLRDLGWEGLPGRRRADLLAKGVRLTQPVRLFALGASPATDRAVALGLLGFLGLVVGGVTFALWRRRQGPAPRPPLAGRKAAG